MATKRFPAMATYKGFNGAQPKGSLLHNDDSHGFPDLNGGGGPSGVRNKPSIGMRDRTGAGTKANGRDPAPTTPMGGRSGSGNPASRGGFPGEARGGAFNPETRVPGHGGSPQHREREIPGDFHKRGGVGAVGQEFVPGGRKSNVGRMGGGSLTAGNTGGLAAKRVIGRFKRGAMGAQASGAESRGSYGSRPVTANT